MYILSPKSPSDAYAANMEGEVNFSGNKAKNRYSDDSLIQSPIVRKSR